MQTSSNVEGVYQGNQEPPPPYVPYDQGFPGGINPTAKQQIVLVRAPRRLLRNSNIRTPITTSLRVFLIISGLVYFFWGVSVIGLQWAVLTYAYSTYYNGFWTGAIILVGGILQTIVGFQLTYPLAHLIRMYMFILGFSIVGFAFSIVDYATSSRCNTFSTSYCDPILATNLKIGLLIAFNICIFHTIINSVFIWKEHKKAVRNSTPLLLRS